MKAVLHQMASGVPVIDLFADAPVGNPKPSAYLLAAYAPWFPIGTVFLCVVDPGVGGKRPAIILEADARWYVGPGNTYSSWFSAAPSRREAGTSTGNRSAYRQASTGAISSLRLQLCWLVVRRHLADLVRTALIARKTGRTTSARSSISIISAMP